MFSRLRLFVPKPNYGRTAKAIVATASFFLLPMDLQAGEIVLGIGLDNLGSSFSEETVLLLEYHSDPIRTFGWGTIALFGVVETDADQDVFVGLGVSSRIPIGKRWFGEASLAAGYYDAGADSLDLGGNVQFRTLIGLGFELSENARLSLAVDHLSNASLERVNPGRNAIFLRYFRSF